MVEKLLSNEVTPSPDGTVALDDVEPFDVELPQAAEMTAIAPTHAIPVRCLSLCKCSPLLCD
jgi:hypothetical protein